MTSVLNSSFHHPILKLIITLERGSLRLYFGIAKINDVRDIIHESLTKIRDIIR